MDYLKGYQSRNRRRREARKRRKTDRGGRAGQDIPGKSALGYRQSSRWTAGDSGPGIMGNRKVMAGLGAAFAVVVLLLVVVFVFPFGDSDESKSAASGSGVEQTATAPAVEESVEVSKQVASVPELSEDAIAVPTQAPRSKAVALTFDDGPSTVNTPKVLAHLKKYNAHATFFVVGNRVAAGAEVLKAEVAQGCEIANHSWDHAHLDAMKMKAVNKEYNKTKRLVKKLTGYNITLLRPPYGGISNVMRKKLKHPMILWSVDTRDWESRNTKAVFKQVKKNVHDGDIILMHDIHPTTAASLPRVLSWLVKHDYDILTVSELMERKGVKMKNGIAYGSVK